MKIESSRRKKAKLRHGVHQLEFMGKDEHREQQSGPIMQVLGWFQGGPAHDGLTLRGRGKNQGDGLGEMDE